MERIAAVLVASTPLRRRIWRFRLVDFFVRMWRLYAPARLMLPLPRTRKRLAAPRLDFIFGITTSFSLTPGGSLREHLKPRLSLVARQLRRLLRLLRLRRAWPMEPSWAPPSAWLLLLLLVASP